jgi:adenosylhomocysteine nucleosidase
MEAYAFAKTCAAFGIPFSCVKYISDGANENSSTDWTSEAGRGWDGFLEGIKSFL